MAIDCLIRLMLTEIYSRANNYYDGPYIPFVNLLYMETI